MLAEKSDPIATGWPALTVDVKLQNTYSFPAVSVPRAPAWSGYGVVKTTDVPPGKPTGP
jgi:hypothetical protein